MEELLQYGVWEFDLDEEDYEEDQDESWVVPVTDLPVTTLSNRIVFVPVRLSNNQTYPGMMGNISLNNARYTKEFLCLSIEKDGEWFHLNRYFDVCYDEMGPSALAEFLGLPVNEVFPISYDLSRLAVGSSDVIRDQIDMEPAKKLTEEERDALGDSMSTN